MGWLTKGDRYWHYGSIWLLLVKWVLVIECNQSKIPQLLYLFLYFGSIMPTGFTVICYSLKHLILLITPTVFFDVLEEVIWSVLWMFLMFVSENANHSILIKIREIFYSEKNRKYILSTLKQAIEKVNWRWGSVNSSLIA